MHTPAKKKHTPAKKHVRAVSNALTLSAVVASPYFGSAAILFVVACVLLLAILAEETA